MLPFISSKVASQFNCLEFVGLRVTPEDGITGYTSDRTQGPACSVACGPATCVRSYFVDMPDGQQGQSVANQIRNLADVSAAIGNEPNGHYFEVTNGYTMASAYGPGDDARRKPNGRSVGSCGERR